MASTLKVNTIEVYSGSTLSVTDAVTLASTLGVTGIITATGGINGTVGAVTPATGAFTTISATGQITSTLATGTAPLVIASTTQVSNLNVSQLVGATWIAPGTIGSTTPNTGAFSTLSSSGLATLNSASITTTLEVTGTLTASALLDISGASAGQISFPASQNASAGANVLDDYEEGTWTPVDSSGASLSFSGAVGDYEKIGRQFRASCVVLYPTTANAAAAKIGGLPFAIGSTAARQGFIAYCDETTAAFIYPTVSGTTFVILTTAGGSVLNSAMSTNEIDATVLSHV